MPIGPIPTIDLFAGPGGLSEGFASVLTTKGMRRFDIRLSIEKDPAAHTTLTTRALFRAFGAGKAPDSYYDYVRGDISRRDLFDDPAIASEVELARNHARLITLGETPVREVDALIRDAIGASTSWVLLGGPPCQAYSLAGRSRMRGVDPPAFARDKRHFLYKEYLRILQEFQPAVFVMENVKGLLSSTHGGTSIFERILADFADPKAGLQYEVRTFTSDKAGAQLTPSSFVVRSEEYGVPQRRHRVLLLGIRNDIANISHSPLHSTTPGLTLRHVLAGLPPIRSCLSREPDSLRGWHDALSTILGSLRGWRSPSRHDTVKHIHRALVHARHISSVGSSFLANASLDSSHIPGRLRSWIVDDRLGGVAQHEARRHMRSDLLRYLFAASFAASTGRSPTIHELPLHLLPDHRNVSDHSIPFADRFRVQPWDIPSTTVVSHIGKDGHYYIHPDPAQCRSLSVREAARLQTFPDNYFFEGNRTAQYGQVGNAVPPYLATQLGDIVAELFSRDRKRHFPQSAAFTV